MLAKENFLLLSYDIRKTKTGKSFLSGLIKDEGGCTYPFIKWDTNMECEVGEVYYIAYEKGDYEGIEQYTIKAVKHIPDADKSSWKIKVNDDHYNLILEQIYRIDDIRLQDTLIGLFIRNKKKFLLASGAISKHHNYAGGLSEHTYEVLNFAVSIAERSHVNMDVIIAAAVIHDWGKIKAYNVNMFGIVDKDEQYYNSDHIITTILTIREFLEAEDEELLNRVEHCILSHHGKLEWGALKEPSSKEAIILHYADMLSTQFYYFDNYEGQVGKFGWTDNKVFPLNRHIYIGKETNENE